MNTDSKDDEDDNNDGCTVMTIPHRTLWVR